MHAGRQQTLVMPMQIKTSPYVHVQGLRGSTILSAYAAKAGALNAASAIPVMRMQRVAQRLLVEHEQCDAGSDAEQVHHVHRRAVDAVPGEDRARAFRERMRGHGRKLPRSRAACEVEPGFVFLEEVQRARAREVDCAGMFAASSASSTPAVRRLSW